ncbi:MAG: CRISPR-associated endoribonuclease Cas6, partial [Bacteroidetes bacterium]|nr:CRISPR-associated endoribonuclease Cas6 [Bacteroidota bacterium]
RYDDDIKEINRILNQNLINKYTVIYNQRYEGKGVTLSWDLDYAINAFKKNKRLSKKVTIIKNTENKIDVIGIFCPFYIEGDPELIKVGYECGFGEKNSMGFGMVAT